MEVISIAAFFLAIFLGIKLLDWGIVMLSDYISGYDNLLPIISFTVIFIAVLVLTHLVGKTIKRILDLTLLGNLDDIAGSLLGVVKWALFISIAFWIYHSFGGTIEEEKVQTSFLFEPVSSFAPFLFDLVSGLFPHFMDFFEHSEEIINQQHLNV